MLSTAQWPARLCLLLMVLLGFGLATQQNHAQARGPRMVIAVSTLFDGTGRVLHDTRVVIEGSRIVAIDPAATPITYDLRGRTVMPGWIDAHVHLNWSFGKDGKNMNGGEATAYAALAAAGNAWATLQAGFTTVQSMGSPNDYALRDAIASGTLPGPRVLTAGEPLFGRGRQTGTPEEIRAFVRNQKQAGADLVKIFASGGMRQGAMTLSPEQLQAACDEARQQGLRALVHVYRDAVPAAVQAGCTQVEHGLGASDEDLQLLAARGVYLDPQAGLLLENYFQFRKKYAGSPFFPPTVEAFAPMQELLAPTQALFQRAVKIPGLKIVFGTDAVAGAHGRNAEEFIYRVRDGGADPMAALVSAQSLGATALGLGQQIGAIAPGMQADIIAIDGDPLKDITAVRRVAFVMRAGMVYKHLPR